MSEKKPRLFYWEDACDSWIPVPDETENLLDVTDGIDDGEIVELKFKRIDMTDEEYDSLPEI